MANVSDNFQHMNKTPSTLDRINSNPQDQEPSVIFDLVEKRLIVPLVIVIGGERKQHYA